MMRVERQIITEAAQRRYKSEITEAESVRSGEWERQAVRRAEEECQARRMAKIAKVAYARTA